MTRANRFLAFFSFGIAFSITPAIAADALPPSPADIRTLTLNPAKITLTGADAAVQVVVTATLNDGRLVDLTHEATYSVADGKTAAVSSTGRASPRANGTSEIIASYGDKSGKAAVVAERFGDVIPMNFPNQVVPVLTKLGCNSGGCHGKLAGQNGFRLSLLGFEPDLDYATLVKEGRGRRVFPANPDASLFLQKATGKTAHGGGRKLDPDSDEYKVIRRWIAAGMPWGSETDPVVSKVTVFPDHRIMARQSRQQVAVYAHYSDGSVEDVTRRAQYDTNDPDTASVDAEGAIRTRELSGEAAIMVRYQGRVAVARVTVPVGLKSPEWSWAGNTVVDVHTAKKWRELGLVPSALCTDEVFVRRIHLDITGTLPTPEQVTAFLADAAPNKRDILIDRLLETPAYAYYFAGKWADVLRVKRRNEPGRAAGTFAFHEWLREQVAGDTPYDTFARSILTADGDERRNPPTVWYKELEKADQFADDVSQVFLGQRLACAQCHHHPYEKWGQDDYWGMAAFFGRVGRKDIRLPSADNNQNNNRVQVIYSKPSGAVTNKRTNKAADMRPLDGAIVPPGGSEDPRVVLADWMTNPKNPFFAKTVANRYWAHFMGRGIVDPLDDMRATNPPSNPALLDALADDLIANKMSLKALIRTICRSRTYQLAPEPNEWNKGDKQSYARHYPKRLSAEVLLDAVCQVTDSPTRFPGLPPDRNAPGRAIMLPDESFTSYFLDVFGRPQRISACECERVTEANLAQALHLLNSEEIQSKIARVGGRAERLAKDPRPDAEKVDEIFVWAFARKPTPADKALALSIIDKAAAKAGPAGKKVAYEDLFWALLNTKEFGFNR